MYTPVPETSPDLATALLIHYSFDLSGYSASELINRWLQHYPVNWLHLAVIEALYQGRYKAVSVQQILLFWQRRGQISYHFNMEFERMICSKFPESLTAYSTPVLPPVKKNTSFERTGSQLSTSAAKPLPTQLNNGHNQRKTMPLQLVSAEEKPHNQPETENVVASPPVSVLTAPATPDIDSGLFPGLNPKETLQINSLLSPIPNKPTKLLPAPINHSPIGQFTPEKSDRTEPFTSKLKAISAEQVPTKAYAKDWPPLWCRP